MTTFHSFQLKDSLLQALDEIGFVQPTPVQEKVIPALLEGKHDMIALAQTGTGKTAAFGLPLLHHLDAEFKKPQALILAPTRELSLQITRDLEKFSVHLTGVTVAGIMGGANIVAQIRLLKKGAQIISATPGRALDLIKRKELNVESIQTIVLDEADEMLNMGFQEDLNEILSRIQKDRNIWLFSATMPDRISGIVKNYMKKPLQVTLGKKNTGSENIKHIYYTIKERDRYAALKRIADYYPSIYGIVFCRTKIETQDVADALIRDGYDAQALHGDLSHPQREQVMKKFREKNLQLLIATDVAARGLDVDHLTHVINYNLPDEMEVYTHRSGRTGRAGRSGVSIVLASPKEQRKIHSLEKLLQRQFAKEHIPSGIEICEKQVIHLANKAKEIEVQEERIAPFMDRILESFAGMERDEVIKHFISMEFNRFLEYYRDDKNLNAEESTKSASGMQRFFLNLGKRDGLARKDLFDLIGKYTKKSNIDMGAIEIMSDFSFFEVDQKHAELILASLQNKSFQGREIRVELAEKSGGGGGKRNKKKAPRYKKEVPRTKLVIRKKKKNS